MYDPRLKPSLLLTSLKDVFAGECTIIRRGKYMSTVGVPRQSHLRACNTYAGRRNVNLHVKRSQQLREVEPSIKDLHVKDERGIEQVTALI